MDQTLPLLREKTRLLYQKIGSVYCPYLSDRVYFSSEGFNHIRYRSARRERHPQVQYLRYKLLYLAPGLLEMSHTLQEYEKRDSSLSSTQFFGFIGILNQRKVKVIVKQSGRGNYHFWSIIPNWKTRKNADQKWVQHYSGDLLDD